MSHAIQAQPENQLIDSVQNIAAQAIVAPELPAPISLLKVVDNPNDKGGAVKIS